MQMYKCQTFQIMKNTNKEKREYRKDCVKFKKKPSYGKIKT